MFVDTMDIIEYWVLFGFAFSEEIQCSSLAIFKDGGGGEGWEKIQFSIDQRGENIFLRFGI